MDKAKIRLSAPEADLVARADWILTKNHILQKVRYILEGLQSEQQQFLQGHPAILPSEIMAITPKISKGENYQGLPWLVLDHPRYFVKDECFAIRTMFWWGNFFSITLQLSGGFKKSYESKVKAAFGSLKKEGFFIAAGGDQWEHHFETSNYLSLKEMNDAEFKSHIRNKEFIKLAKRFSLEQWDEAGDVLFKSFSQLIRWMTG